MTLTALSPLDNRYTSRLTDLVPCLSHYALIAYRVQIEIEWLRFQSEHPELTHVRAFTDAEHQILKSWINTFDEQQAQRVVAIEKSPITMSNPSNTTSENAWRKHRSPT